jgi:hypothetical protein
MQVAQMQHEGESTIFAKVIEKMRHPSVVARKIRVVAD